MTTITEVKAAFANGAQGKHDYIQQMHDLHKVLFEYSIFIQSTDIKKIEITDGAVVMTSRESGLKLLCDPTDRRIAPIEILNFGHYEQEDSEMILRLINEGDTVFDIGGNFGWYSLNIAKAKHANVYAFEPIPKTYGYLCKNVELNGLDRVRAFNFGFSDSERELTFYYYPEGSGNSSSVDLSSGAGVEKVTCQVRTVDAFAAEQKVRVDFIKCDVEGAELMVFRGGLETIRRDTPVVFAELLRKWAVKFGYHPNEVLQLFRDAGYRCFTVQGSRLREFGSVDDETRETNFFFLHATKHRDLIHSLSAP